MITINGYAIDAALTEDHEYASEVTQYPVEQGSDITDNVRNLPIEVKIEGLVSDTPIGVMASVRGKETASTTSDLEFLPSDDALARLLAIRDAREPVTIETSLKVFENMLLEDLDIPRDASTGAALRFTATFKQVILVTNARTVVRVSPPANGSPGGASKQDKGGKVSTDITTDFINQTIAYGSLGQQMDAVRAGNFQAQLTTLADRGQALNQADQVKFIKTTWGQH